jgi:hypothetical protein
MELEILHPTDTHTEPPKPNSHPQDGVLELVQPRGRGHRGGEKLREAREAEGAALERGLLDGDERRVRIFPPAVVKAEGIGAGARARRERL